MASHTKACDLTMEELEKMCESTTEKETKKGLVINARLSFKTVRRAENVVRKLRSIDGIKLLSDNEKGYEKRGSYFMTYDVDFSLPVDRIEEICDALCIYPENGTFMFTECF